jgi:hypothetical protein
MNTLKIDMKGTFFVRTDADTIEEALDSTLSDLSGIGIDWDTFDWKGAELIGDDGSLLESKG